MKLNENGKRNVRPGLVVDNDICHPKGAWLGRCKMAGAQRQEHSVLAWTGRGRELGTGRAGQGWGLLGFKMAFLQGVSRMMMPVNPGCMCLPCCAISTHGPGKDTVSLIMLYGLHAGQVPKLGSLMLSGTRA